MDLRRRGVLTLLSLFTILAVVGTGERYFAPATPVLAQDANPPEFFETLPASVYAGDPSHEMPANADPTLPLMPLNGYCVRVNSSTHSPVGGDYGFQVQNGDIVPDGIPLPDPTAFENPDRFQNDTTQTNDDIYCIVVQARDDGSELMTITWTYEDTEFGGVASINLEIRIVTVTLVGIDGVVGASATVCTVGWDQTILTGNEANVDADDQADRLDAVVKEDWILTSSTVPSPYVSRSFKDGNEWCVSIKGDVASSDIDIELRFDAVYDVQTDADDRFDTTVFYHVATSDNIVNLLEVWYSELRHMTIAGVMDPSQSASWNVASSRHTACIIPSNASDTVRAEDIVFLPAQGEEQLPDVSEFVLFTNDEIPSDDPLNHVLQFPDLNKGTWCFSWTSHTPGEQAIYLTFTKNDGQFPGQRFVSWDSNGDGNPDSNGVPTGPSNGALVKKWNRIIRTEITRGNSPTENVVTNGTIVATVDLAISNGTYVLRGGLRVTEWVFGSHRAPNGETQEGLLDGVVLVASFNSQCGYFVSEQSNSIRLGRVINGVSVGGRFDRTQVPQGPASDYPWSSIDVDGDEPNEQGPNQTVDQVPAETLGDGPDDIVISITGDGNCRAGTTVELQIDAYYPSALLGGTPVLVHTEMLDVKLQHQVNQKKPRIAWAGQIVTLDYGFGGGSNCAAADLEVHFVKQADAPGNFLADAGWTLNGPNHAYTLLGTDCLAQVRFESEQAGEVDVEAFLVPTPDTPESGLATGERSKIAYPLFYLAFEDIQLTASSEQVVSAFGDVTARIRGYFVGANSSGREGTVTADGRTLPANRWVIPDDWERLKGVEEYRQNWDSATLPPTIVTFFMSNEGIKNDFKQRVFNGAAGFFVVDGDDEISINVNPRTGEESILGSVFQPRIITDMTDGQGIATVDTFGDFNLGYNECAVNPSTGSPHCALDDIVGQTQFYSIVDYPNFHGQLPPARSGNAQTAWTWAGYKTVTVEDSNVPTQKYVVVRMRDRDGFCDAINPNNVLGIAVEFRIDAGDGILIDYKGQPVDVSLDSRGAIVTSFDTQDDRGVPMNVEILRPIASETGDECQAWIKISRSLPGTVNVEVTIPSIPAPPPGDIRFSGIQCNGNETLTVTQLRLQRREPRRLRLPHTEAERRLGPPWPHGRPSARPVEDVQGWARVQE